MTFTVGGRSAARLAWPAGDPLDDLRLKAPAHVAYAGAGAHARPPCGAPRHQWIIPPNQQERFAVASEGEYRAAIAKVAHSPKTASRDDWNLVERAAQQAGELGNKARDTLKGR